MKVTIEIDDSLAAGLLREGQRSPGSALHRLLHLIDDAQREAIVAKASKPGAGPVQPAEELT